MALTGGGAVTTYPRSRWSRRRSQSQSRSRSRRSPIGHGAEDERRARDRRRSTGRRAREAAGHHGNASAPQGATGAALPRRDPAGAGERIVRVDAEAARCLRCQLTEALRFDAADVYSVSAYGASPLHDGGSVGRRGRCRPTASWTCAGTSPSAHDLGLDGMVRVDRGEIPHAYPTSATSAGGPRPCDRAERQSGRTTTAGRDRVFAGQLRSDGTRADVGATVAVPRPPMAARESRRVRARRWYAALEAA